MKWLSALVITSTIAIPAAAQDLCETGTANAFLEANDVRAAIFNAGNLFFGNGRSTYEVPIGSDTHAVFSSMLWFGGLVDGELRISASYNDPKEMWPGPVGATSLECDTYDRIFSVTSDDLDRWSSTGVATADMLDWPWTAGAPVTDGDGNPGNYELAVGDHPELLGDQTLWWIMNDAGGMHGSTHTAPLEMEVASRAFASTLPEPVSQTTFYEYRFTNRSERPLRSAYVSMFVNTDLGYAADDYVGSDSTVGMAYSYNADNDDEGNYGASPPAIGFVFLESPGIHRPVRTSSGMADPGLSSYMTSFVNFPDDGGPQGYPQTAQEYYLLMQGRWKTGQAMTVGGDGLGFSSDVTTFAKSGEPGSFWSELDTDDNGNRATAAERRWMASSGPFDLDPGESAAIYFAIVWSRGRDNLDSVRQLKKDAAIVKQVAPTLLKPIYEYHPDIPPEPDYPLGANGIYPNPTSEFANLDYSLPQPMRVRVEVFDVLGRRVFDGARGMRDAGEYTAHFDVTDWPAGVYTARLQLDHITTTKTFAVVR